MSDLEFYSWIVFFVVGLASLPVLFHYRKKILKRIRILAIQAKATAHAQARKAIGLQPIAVDPWGAGTDTNKRDVR